MKIVDFSGTADRSIKETWRQRAVELASERHLIGQAWETQGAAISPGDRTFVCRSASEPIDYNIVYHPSTESIRCSCKAGWQGHPCAHAGAVLLLVHRLAAARKRLA